MKQIRRRALCMILAILVAAPWHPGMVRAASGNMVMTVRAADMDPSRENYFSYTAYAGKSWTNNADESYIDLGESDDRAQECYYEVHFKGSGISLYAVKAPAHGKVKVTVDGKNEQTVDLYSSERTSPQEVYTLQDLPEEEHVLKAVTLPEKSGSKIVNQVHSARITYKPVEGEPDLGGAACDTNWQYTSDRYEDIAGRNDSAAKLYAWKNDKATGELALYTKNCSLKNVRVTASPLKSQTDTIGEEHVKTVFIKSTKAYSGGYVDGVNLGGVFPATDTNRSDSADILYQHGGSVDMDYNSVQPVWVEFDIPKDARAGTYTGTVTATADGIKKPLTFTYTVVVQDMELPDAESFKDTFDIELWQYPYTNAEYYDVEPFSEEHYELMESSMQIYKSIGGHAITTTISEEAWNGQTYSKNEVHYPSMVKWTKESDGSFTYDYTDFDKWVSYCKELGIGDKIILYSIAPWHGSFTYWDEGELVYEGYSAGSERYNTVWGDFLEDLIAHLEEKDWFDDAYVGIDERGFSAAAFDLIESVKNSEGKCLKTAGAMDSFISQKDLAMRVTDLNVGDTAAWGHPEDFQKILDDRKAAGLRTTLYSCTGHRPGNFSMSMPAESYWSVVNAGKMGTAGFLRWAYDAWVEDPLRDTTHSLFEPGDCFLIFPDEKDALDPQSKTSVRLERMAEGIRDVNKLKIIEEEMPELAEEIQNLYDGIRTIAVHGSFLDEAAKFQLAQEMTAFKAGVARITGKYLYLTAGNSAGMFLQDTEKSLRTGETYQIPVKLNSSHADKTIIYVSSNPMVAAVDAEGTVTARAPGKAEITLKNKASGYTQTMDIFVSKVLSISNKLTDYKLPEQYLSDIEKDENNEKGRRYLGQPDMAMLNDNKTLVTVYPVGHGVGPIVMQISRDAGETWEEKTDIPSSWETSYETPTLYKLNMANGSEKLILISGRPESFGAPSGGWDASVSSDGGESWSEFDTYCETLGNGSRNETVVAMASLIQLKDADGNYMDKWMGVYHNGTSFVNYKTYLTFDEDGRQQWTTPEPYLSDYRPIEWERQICEVGLFRSPDGKRIVGLARSQSHNNPATMFYSDDEGETWSRPVDLPGSLAGERHKAMYDPTDPTGQRLIVTFREICYDLDDDGQFGGGSDWKAGDWIAWVGTYDDIMNQDEGQYRILLCEDWAANAKSGDTGYTGLVVQPDGTYIMDSYGHWDREYSESLPNYNVYNDLCYIKQAKFKLSDLDNQVLSVFVDQLEAELELIPQDAAAKYTKETWDELKKAEANALAVLSDAGSSQNACYAAYKALQKARLALVMQGAQDDPAPKPPKPEPPKPEPPKPEPPKPEPPKPEGITEGKVYASGNYSYKVTSVSKKTVTVTKAKSKNIKSITVPDSVKLGGVSYQVTAIADAAFKNYKLAASAKIGKNVETIGKNAFAGCVKLKSVALNGKKLKKIGNSAFSNCKILKKITIKSTALKTVGKNAFKGIDKNAQIKVPANKLKKYKKILAKKGQAKSVKIKK